MKGKLEHRKRMKLLSPPCNILKLKTIIDEKYSSYLSKNVGLEYIL